MKSRTVFSIILLGAILTVFLWKPLLELSADFFLKRYLRSKEIVFDYERLKFLDNAFVLKNAQFKKGKSSLKAPSISITFEWPCKIYLKNPEVMIEKQVVNLPKEDSFSHQIFIDSGKVVLREKEQVISEFIVDSQSLKKPHYQIEFSEHSSLNFTMGLEGCNLFSERVLLSDLTPLFYFCGIEDLKGSGIFSGNVNYGARLFLKVQGKDVSIQTKELQFKADQIHCDLYEKEGASDALLGDFFIPKSLQKKQAQLSTTNLTLTHLGKVLFQNVSGRGSYHPQVGPKLHFTGLIDQTPAELSGRGFFHSRQKNWLEMRLNFQGKEPQEIVLEGEERENLHLSLKGDDIKLKDLSAFKNALSYFYPHLSHVQKLEGLTSFEIEALARQELDFLDIKHISFKDLRVYSKDDQIDVFLPEIKLASSFSFHQPKLFDDLWLSLEMNRGALKCHFPECVFEISELFTLTKIKNGSLLPSDIDFLFNQEKGKVELSGPLNDLACRLTFDGKIKSLARVSPIIRLSEEVLDQSMSMVLVCKNDAHQAKVLGNLKMEEENSLFHTLSFGVKWEWEKIMTSCLPQGWLKGERVDLGLIDPILSYKWKGVVDFSAALEDHHFNVYMMGQDIKCTQPYVQFAIPTISDRGQSLYDSNSLFFSYDLKEKKSFLTLDLKKASLHIPAFNLEFSSIEGKLKMEDRCLSLQIDSAFSDHIEFSGLAKLQVDGLYQFDMETKQATGSVKDFTHLVRHFDPYFSLPFEGNITGKNRGFYLTTNFDTQTDFGFEMHLDQGVYQFSEDFHLQDLTADIVYRDSLFSLNNAEGKLMVKGSLKPFRVNIQEFKKAFDHTTFDIRLEKPMWDIVRLKGSYENIEGEKHFFIDSNYSEVYGAKLMVQNMVLSKDHALESMNLSLLFPLEKLEAVMRDFHVMPSIDQLGMQGNLNLYYELGKKESLSLVGENLIFLNQAFQSLKMHSKKEQDKWLIEEFNLDDWLVKGSLNFQNYTGMLKVYLKNLADMTVDLSLKDREALSMKISDLWCDLEAFKDLDLSGEVSGKGLFFMQLPFRKKPFDFEGDLDLSLIKIKKESMLCENLNPLHLYYSLDKGLVAKDLELIINDKERSIQDYTLSMESFSYDEAIRFEKLRCYLPQNFCETLKSFVTHNFHPFLDKLDESFDFTKAIPIKADVNISDVIWFKLKALKVKIEGEEREFQNLFFAIKDHHLEWESDLEEKYKIKGFYDFEENPKGRICFQDEASQLGVNWTFKDHDLHFEDIQGSFAGISASLHEVSPFDLSGNLQIDFSKASNLLPKEIKQSIDYFALGKGYDLRGHFYLNPRDKTVSFDGILSGKSFDLLGYEFKTLISKLKFDPQHFHLKDFKISDSSGILKVENVFCDVKEGEWRIHIPSVLLKEFRPSLLQEVGKERKDIDPLLVRYLEMKNFRGKLNDSSTYKGEGKLYFINSFKREHTLFDIPADFLGRIFGLDLELLIPVVGDVHFKIEDQKTIFTDLKESFSQNNRSKFFLAYKDELPYMDFQGNLYVNIGMKQYVIFKFTEHFIIEIGGSLMNPHFKLKRKKSFFSS